MQTDKHGMHNPEDLRGHDISHPEHYDAIRERDLNIDKNASGKDILEEGREARHHHQEHGNRKYESYRNHSSADDQPQVNTDLNPERGRDF
jgi:hypothetical protein